MLFLKKCVAQAAEPYLTKWVFILYHFLRFSWKVAVSLFIKKLGQLLWE